MQVNITRGLDPERFGVTVNFTAEDIRKAFVEKADPDEQLFYDTFGPGVENVSTSVALERAAKLAKLVETQEAKVLDATASVELRGT